MFLKPATLNGLMKQAYKSGLTVARTADDWLYIAGNYWEVSVKREFVPKRTMGDIIALAGELPLPGERFQATKYGNQIETEMRLEVYDEPFREEFTLTNTNVLLVGNGGVVQRLLQDESTGHIYVVNNVFMAIVDNALIEKDRGEYEVTEPLFCPGEGILWKNNVCKLKAQFRRDDKNKKVLENLKGVDITPEVPQ